jgi:alpha-L-arabinofuranosidase
VMLSPTSWRVLAAPDIHAHNTFEQPEAVTPQEQNSDGCVQSVTLPAASVSVIQYQLQK